MKLNKGYLLITAVLLFAANFMNCRNQIPVKVSVEQRPLDVAVSCAAEGIRDQDDMCIWVNLDDGALSTVIVSDKSAHKLFVYGLDGTGKYTYPLQHRPGNIDIIYNFPFQGELIDIVGFNTRSTTNACFVFYKVDRATGRLEYLGSVKTDGWAHELYGFCLYYGVNDRILYAFGCDKSNVVQQYRLFVDGSGQIAGKKVRRWQNGSNEGPTEGLVADMEHGLLYAANEKEGIYVYLIDEKKPARPIRHLGIEKGQLEIDVEGLAIYYAEEGKGYLIASSQAQNYFSIFERSGDNNFAGRFYVKNV